jgi:hypothetical protein
MLIAAFRKRARFRLAANSPLRSFPIAHNPVKSAGFQKRRFVAFNSKSSEATVRRRPKNLIHSLAVRVSMTIAKPHFSERSCPKLEECQRNCAGVCISVDLSIHCVRTLCVLWIFGYYLQCPAAQKSSAGPWPGALQTACWQLASDSNDFRNLVCYNAAFPQPAHQACAAI